MNGEDPGEMSDSKSNSKFDDDKDQSDKDENKSQDFKNKSQPNELGMFYLLLYAPAHRSLVTRGGLRSVEEVKFTRYKGCKGKNLGTIRCWHPLESEGDVADFDF